MVINDKILRWDNTKLISVDPEVVVLVRKELLISRLVFTSLEKAYNHIFGDCGLYIIELTAANIS